MRIDVVFDTICPWCFIGKHRIERALASRPKVRAEFRWRPFLLNPDMPDEGMDYAFYLERKFGSSYRVQRIQSAIVQAGESEGIAFNFDTVRRIPRSVNSHRLIQWAAESGRQSELVEAVFRAYFVGAQDIGSIAVLCDIAASCGLDRKAAANYLHGPAGYASVEAENGRVHRLGVGGIPCYIIDGHYAVSGAQEPDMLARLIDIAQGEAELEASSF